MPKTSKAMEWAREQVENKLTMLTLCAILVGLGLRWVADPKTFVSELKENALKEIGTFILVTFVVAFIYENFINYKNKREFTEELESILSDRMNLPLSKVFSQRPELNDKAALIKKAKREVIECGTALRTFTNYLSSDMSFHTPEGGTGRYRQLIEQRLADGVDVKCIMLDPAVAETLHDLEPDLPAKVKNSYDFLKKFEAEIAPKGYRGKFHIILYKAVPHYAAICIDGDDPTDGAMLMSPYIAGTPNSRVPAFLLERSKGNELFSSYWEGIKAMVGTAK